MALPSLQDFISGGNQPAQPAKLPTVAPAGGYGAGSPIPLPTQQSSFGPVNAKQQAKVGDTTLNIGAPPVDYTMAIVVIVLVLLALGAVWLVL